MKSNRKMDRLRIEIIITVISVILMLLVLGFTGGLNIAAFEKNYTNSMVANYAAIGGKTVQKIEYAVRYGKPIDNFFGMKELLLQNTQDLGSIEDIKVILKNKKIAYALKDTVNEGGLSEKLLKTADFNDAEESTAYSYGQADGKYHVFLPVRDAKGQWIASYDMVFDRQNVLQPVYAHILRLVKYLVILALFGICILFVVNRIFILIKEDGSINSRGLLVRLLLIMGCLQLIYGFMNYNIFGHAYREIANDNAKSTALIVQKDIENVIAKGIGYNELYKLDAYLKKTIATSLDLEGIELVDNSGKMIFSSSGTSGQPYGSNRQGGACKLDLAADPKGHKASIYVTISEANIAAKMQDIILDTLTVLIMSFFFMLELTLLVSALIKRKAACSSTIEMPGEKGNIDTALLRALSFIVFTCIFIPTAIIPVMMIDLYKPVLGMPKDVILGMPITMAFLSSAIGMLASGSLIDKKGWKNAFFAGCILVVLGAFISAISATGTTFIIARTVSGFGDGFLIMSLRGFAAANKDMNAEGFAGLNIGLNSGINCGVFIGSMLADKVNFPSIFMISIAIAAIAAVFAAGLMKNIKPLVRTASKEKTKIGLESFLLDKRVFALFAFVIVPTAICGTFLNFFLPLFFEANAISPANISRAYLINGICIIGLTSLLCAHINKRFGHRISSALASAIIIFALCVFALKSSLAAAFLVAAALGIAESFGVVAYDSYLLSLRATASIGEGKALSYLTNVKRVGQMLGPIVFGSVAALGSYGIGIIGLVFLGATLLFISLSSENKHIGQIDDKLRGEC